MPASPASASARTEAVLVVGVNWLGDSVMSLPALQAFRRARPATRLVMLVKPPLAPLCSLHPAIDEVWTFSPGAGGVFHAAQRAAGAGFSAAFILPHSFRSALPPFLARIPERIGLPGHARDWMLTRVVRPPSGPGREHQAHEYRALFGVADAPDEPPALALPPALGRAAGERLAGLGAPRVALLPGAARGPSKRWPCEHFIALGQGLLRERPCGIVVLGSEQERALCERVAAGIGAGAVSLAGRTTLPELAALLAQCALAVGNDSGGLHLAAAVGVPVLTIFGITDPRKTGPLGPRVRVLQGNAPRSRDIARHSEEAVQALRRITPEQALAAARELIEAR